MKIKIEIGGNVKSFDIAENDVERFKQKFLDLADVDNFDYDKFCKFVAEDFVGILETEVVDVDYGLFNY